MTLDLCWNVVRLSFVRVAHSKKRNFGLVSDPSARNQLVLTSLTSNDGFCNFNLCKLLIVLTRFQFSKKKQLKVGSLPPHYFLEKKKMKSGADHFILLRLVVWLFFGNRT